MNEITIKASTISSAIGVGFTTPDELIKEILYPYKKRQEYKKLQENKIIEQANQFKSQNSTDVKNKIKELHKEIEDDEDDEDELKKEVTKILSTNHGTLHENTTATKCNRLLTRDDTYRTLHICNIDGVDYIIGGFIDRIEMNEDGTRTLVEIKNRINRLFYKVRDYENIQCQVYLQMLKDIRYCRLVEQYNDTLNENIIEKDDDTWTSITLPKIKRFCVDLHKEYKNYNKGF